MSFFNVDANSQNPPRRACRPSRFDTRATASLGSPTDRDKSGWNGRIIRATLLVRPHDSATL